MLGSMKKTGLVLGCVLALPAPAIAAPTQGTAGATSTGSVGISATIPGRVQISGLSDIAFGTVDPSTAASSAENLCVWSNTSGKGYTVTALGSGTSNAFTLTDGTNNLAYSVEWAERRARPRGPPLPAARRSAA